MHVNADLAASVAKMVDRSLCSVIGRSCHKYHFCCHKTFVTANMCLSRTVLSWQAYFCHDKRRVFCHNKHVFVAAKVSLSQQKFCHDKNMFAATNVFSQAYFCCNKRCILSWQTLVCHDKHVFAMTKLWSQQKWHLWQLPPMTVFSCKTDSTYKCLEACHNTNFMQSLSRTSTHSQNTHQVNSADYHAPRQILLASDHTQLIQCLFVCFSSQNLTETSQCKIQQFDFQTVKRFVWVFWLIPLPNPSPARSTNLYFFKCKKNSFISA